MRFFPLFALLFIINFQATTEHNHATNELSLKLEQAKTQQLAQKREYDILLSEAKKEIEILKKEDVDKSHQQVKIKASVRLH